MSRASRPWLRRCARFPRVSGDEPNGETRVINFYAFSPRERG